MNWIGQHIWSFISRFRSDVYLEDVDSSSDTQILVRNSTTGKVTYNTSAGAGAADQDLWETITSDSGSVAANTTTDTLTIAGGTNCATAISGDTLTINSTDTNTNGLTTFRLSADVVVGANQTLAHNNTLIIAGGDGINTTTTATDTANVIIDTSQTTITDIYNQALALGYAGDEGYSINFNKVGIGADNINFLADGVIKYQMQNTGIYPLHNVSDLGVTGARFKNIWLSELCTATGLVAETSLTLDSVVLTTVQTSEEIFINNDVTLMTAAAAEQRFRRTYFELEGYSTGDGAEFKIPSTDTINKQKRAPEHTQKAGSDGLLALVPGTLLRTAGIYMPYGGRLITWKGWETSSGSGSSYVSLFKYTPTANDATADSLVLLKANTFTAAGNNNLLALEEDVAGTTFAAGDILISGIKGVNAAAIHFYSILEVEFD